MTHWPLCTLEGCGRIHYAKGLCQGHYQKAKKVGIDPRQLNDKQVELVDQSQRRMVINARGFDTAVRKKAQAEARLERKTHEDYIGFLRRNELAYVHANPVRKSTIQKGCPDFVVTGGEKYGYRACYGEFKRPGQKLSEVQQEYVNDLLAKGCKVYVWYDYETAIRDTAEFFELELPLVRG